MFETKQFASKTHTWWYSNTIKNFINNRMVGLCKRTATTFLLKLQSTFCMIRGLELQEWWWWNWCYGLGNIWSAKDMSTTADLSIINMCTLKTDGWYVSIKTQTESECYIHIFILTPQIFPNRASYTHIPQPNMYVSKLAYWLFSKIK